MPNNVGINRTDSVGWKCVENGRRVRRGYKSVACLLFLYSVRYSALNIMKLIFNSMEVLITGDLVIYGTNKVFKTH